jgi:hypothetical protein
MARNILRTSTYMWVTWLEIFFLLSKRKCLCFVWCLLLLVVEQRSEESDVIPTNNCVVGKKSSLYSSRKHENQSLHYKKNRLTKPFGNLFNTKDWGRRWQLDYLQPLQVLVINAKVASLISIQTEEPSVKWTSSMMLSRPLLQTWTTHLPDHVLFMLHYSYLGLAAFTLISFHLSITKRTMWIDPIAQWHTCISSSTSKMFSYCQTWHNLVPCQLWH